MQLAQIILEYLKVVLSGPLVIGVAVLMIVRLFKTEFQTLIRNGFKLRIPGFGEVETQYGKTLAEPETPPVLNPPPENSSEIETSKGPAADPEVAQIIRSERARAALWEYRYLHHYLVRTTQTVLDWIFRVNAVSRGLFDAELHMVPVHERAAILSALRDHYLVTIDGEMIKITPKGREYVRVRGPLPPIAASNVFDPPQALPGASKGS
jgi:hypothetical protein